MHTLGMITTCIHTVLIYLFLLVVVRLMGKRQIGELQASEFIITILLSEIASAPITTEQFPLLHGIVSVLILVALEFLISSALLRFNGLKKFFYGAPSVVINKGKIDMREMRQNRMEIDELMSELRQKGFSDPADVYYAILEENGKLSVFPTADKAPATPADLRLTPDEHGIAHACILDGQVIPKNLTLVGWDRARLEQEIRRRGMSVSDVFVFTVDDLGQITCIGKERGCRK